MFTKEEIETVIVIEPYEKQASIYTNFYSDINRFKKLAEENECISIKHEDEESIEIELPSKWIKINKPREISEERRKALSEMGKKLAKARHTA